MAKLKIVSGADRAAVRAAAKAAELPPPLTDSNTRIEDVAKPSKRAEELTALRELPRTLMGGTKAMREAGTKYLPQHPAEEAASYTMRIMSTTLYNAFKETVSSESGKFFKKPITIGDDVPPAVKDLLENVDGQGRALDPFTVELVKESFVDGISFILVDFPKMSVGATMADQIRSGARPYWCLIKADSILGIRTQNIAGQQTITQVRITENTFEPVSAFKEEEIKRVRVLVPGAWYLYRQQKDENNVLTWVLEDQGFSSLPYVPIVPFYTNRVGYMEGEPPLSTLADLNQEHWVSSSEQRRALSYLRFAMLAIIGVDADATVVVGPDQRICVPNPAGDVKYVEHSGKGIEAGQKDLQDIEKRMQSAGMQLRVENQGTVTATAAAIDSAETNAVLSMVARGLEDAIEQALQMTADLLNLKNGGTVDVNDDFGNIVIPGTPVDLTTLRNSGGLSLTTLWDEFKRRNILPEDFDGKKELQIMAAEQELFMPGGPLGPPEQNVNDPNQPGTDNQQGAA